jgi:putative copper export protein
MSFLIRTVHLVSVAFLLGGALLLLLLFQIRRKGRLEGSSLLEVLRVYESASWASVGLAVMSGVGNLGRFGEALPKADTEWGREFSVKMVLVLLFVLLSVVRTLSVAFASSSGAAPISRKVERNLLGLYGASAVLLVAVAGFAVAMAHF